MTTRDSLDSLYLRWFSKPKHERTLYQLIKKQRVQTIVEIGLRDLQRSVRMIRMARLESAEAPLQYTGVDLFEARTDRTSPLTLKQAHQTLSHTGAKIRLMPGPVDQVLARCANQLSGTQLLIISGDVDRECLQRGWFYVPRMLNSDSIVLMQDSNKDSNLADFQRVSREEIERLARAQERSIRKAA